MSSSIDIYQMEIYKQLAREFQDTQTPKDHLIHYKTITDQLHTHQQHKLIHLITRKQQLHTHQQLKHPYSQTCSQNKHQNNRLSQQKQDLITIDRIDLKKKIGQIDQEMQVLKDKTQQINEELRILVKKEKQIEIVSKRSEMEVLNANQELIIQSTKINQESKKEEDIIKLLQHKRSSVAHQIKTMITKKQSKIGASKKLHKSKQKKIQSLQELGMDPSELKQIVQIMQQLNNLMLPCQQKPQNRQQLQHLKLLHQKTDILQYLTNNNIHFNYNLTNQLVCFYRHLQDQFDRYQRTNQQMNYNLQSLNGTYDKMLAILQNQINHTKKQTQLNLQQFQYHLLQLQQSLSKKTNLTVSFTNKCYFILKRIKSLRSTITSITGKSSKNRQIQKGDQILNQYKNKLNKNPQDTQVQWFQILSTNRSFYHNYIQTNDLLRLFASPNNYQYHQHDLNNYQMFIIECFRMVNEFIRQMQQLIKSYFHVFNKNKNKRMMTQNNEGKFCVQANDYYRRDNYKLLERLKKVQLKKKGLLASIPFNIYLQNQLIKDQKQDKPNHAVFTPKVQNRQRSMKYTGLASKRQERGVKGRVLMNMFGQLNSLRSSSSRLINVSSMKDSRMMKCYITQTKLSKKKIKRQPSRKTISVIPKQNSEIF